MLATDPEQNTERATLILAETASLPGIRRAADVPWSVNSLAGRTLLGASIPPSRAAFERGLWAVLLRSAGLWLLLVKVSPLVFFALLGGFYFYSIVP